MTKPFLIRYARVALLAMLWQIALPLGNAIATTRGMSGEVPVCTASGIKWIKVGEQAPEQKQSQQHCPLCVTGQGETALVDSHAAIFIPLSVAQETRLPVVNVVRPALARGTPPPARAPPSFS